MPAWNDDERERQRQREADRIASEKNPPKPANDSPCKVEWIDGFDGPRPNPMAYCRLGTKGCWLDHADEPTYAETLKASNERVKAGEQKSHWTGD